MLTYTQFNTILSTIGMLRERPSSMRYELILQDHRYYRITNEWSDWASTIANVVLPDASTSTICSFIQLVDDLDTAYSYYLEAINQGYAVRSVFMNLKIHTHRPKSLNYQQF